jgi:hypothetical protein
MITTNVPTAKRQHDIARARTLLEWGHRGVPCVECGHRPEGWTARCAECREPICEGCHVEAERLPMFDGEVVFYDSDVRVCGGCWEAICEDELAHVLAGGAAHAALWTNVR